VVNKYEFSGKASPFVWAAGVGLEGANTAAHPESAENFAHETAEKPWYQRAWSGFSNPVKSIAGATTIVGQLAKQKYDQANSPQIQSPATPQGGIAH